MVMAATHPEPALLADFGLGKLSDAEAESIEEHLGQCDSCCQQLEEIAADDSFAALVRGCDPDLEPHTGAIPPRAAVRDPSARNSGDVQGQTRRISESLASHPRYAVRELVGIGGMGAVYRASHRLMDRQVAVKVIRPEILTRPGAVDRFHREVQTAAKLSHPNIVTAHDAEQVDDQHLLVMEFVERQNLAEEIAKRGPLPVSEACDYIRQAALGLQHAHEQGMVHRDIKPHNLMLTPAGQVKILDFGLASLVANKVVEGVGDGDDTSTTVASLTRANTMIGTPDYIAPEQITDAHSADIRSDIYGLGCTFYFLLTGKPPFADASAMEKIRAHHERQPRAIGELRTDLPTELAAVIMKMMAKDPAERYQKPAEVAVALAPLIETAHEVPVLRTEVSSGGSRSGFRIGMLLLGMLPIFFAVAGTVIYVKTDKGTVAIETDDPNVRVIVEQNGSQVKILDQKNNQEAILNTGSYSVRLGRDAAGFDLSLPEGEPFLLKRGEEKIVTVRRVKELAVPHVDSVVPSGVDGPQHVEEPQQPGDVPLVRQLNGHAGPIYGLAVWAGGQRAVSTDITGQVRMWDIEAGRTIRTFETQPHRLGARGVAIAPDHKTFAISDGNGLVYLLDTETGRELQRWQAREEGIPALAFSPDGDRLAVVGWGRSALRIWNVNRDSVSEVQLPPGTSGAMDVAYSPDGREVAAGGHQLYRYDATSGRLLGAFDFKAKLVVCDVR